jgi:hypothetical protein
VYVRTVSGSGAKRRISIAGGSQPRWRGDGRELFYLEGATLMAVRIRMTDAEVESEAPHPLFALPRLGQTFYSYDIGANGDRFLVLQPVGGSAAGALTVISGW